jgi:hypothetical protein
MEQKHNQLAALRWIKLKLGFPDNERMTNEIGHWNVCEYCGSMSYDGGAGDCRV